MPPFDMFPKRGFERDERAVTEMSNWLVPLAIGFPIGALIAATPMFLRGALNRRARHRLPKTGLRPRLRVRVMISPDANPNWAHLAVHVSNRTKDIWWLQQIDLPDGNAKGALKSDRLFAGIDGNLSAVPIDALPRFGPMFPSRSIHPDANAITHFTGVEDGTCEHAYLYCPDGSGSIAVDVTLRRMGGRERAITIKAVRSVSWEQGAD